MNESDNTSISTNKAQIVQLNKGGLEILALKYEGQLNIITSNQLEIFILAMNKIPTLEQDLEEEKAKASRYRKNGIEYKNKYEELLSKYNVKKAKYEEAVNNKKQMEEKIEKLEKQYGDLNVEYNKLKSFKEQQNKGRQPVLTAKQIANIQNWTLKGHTAKKIHNHLFNNGVVVSYETVRKIVADTQKKNGQK